MKDAKALKDTITNKKKKEIILAPHSGFCFGVKRAINMALEVEGENCFACGSLIHNKRVTQEISKKGIKKVDSIKEVPDDSTAIVRSHGEGKSFFDYAKEKNIKLVDTTCPFVTKIHQLVRDANKMSFQVIIVGDKNHPEVIGTCGWTGEDVKVFSSGKETEEWLSRLTEKELEILREKKVFLVAQTTIKKEDFDDVIKALERWNLKIEIHNTICNATIDRQKGCMETAKNVDFMVVIGDKDSSNSKKLFEIANNICDHACFIESFKELSLKELEKYSKIGVAAGASTPEIAIKEVISSMSEQTLEQETMTMQELVDQYEDEIEKSLRLPRSGELITGKVHQVNDKEVIVNLGCKKDGIVPASEVSMEDDQKLTDMFSEGDEIQVKVLKTDDGDGSILLSRKKLEVGKHWQEINQALEDKSLIEVEVVRQVNGGVIANYKEVSGFIPLSQLSHRYIEDSSEFVGQTLQVKVSRVDPRRGKAIFSRKAYLNEERAKILEEVWEKIHVDDIVEGTVMRFTDYGAFVDIGGIDGLLHISEISWGKLKHPQEVLSVGEKINVKVLSMNKANGKISLGLKQTVPEPWTVIDEKYNVGDVVKGKIVQIKEYGCFVELEPGLDGLVHISEVSHSRIANINDVLSIGEEVETKILEIDKDRKRISLSIKETIEPPTEEEIAAQKAAATEAKKEESASVEEPKAETAPAEEPVAEAAPVEEPKVEEPAVEATKEAEATTEEASTEE